MALTQHWPLNDNAASTTVVATVGNNAALLGGDNTSAKSVAGPGNLATHGFSLNGTDDAIDITGANISFGSGVACSFSAWFKKVAGVLCIFGTTSATSSNSIRITADTTVIVRPASTGLTYTIPNIADGAWHHILVTRDTSNNWRVFIDGVESVTGSQAGAAAMTLGNTIARVGLVNTDFSDGAFSYLKVFDSDESANVATLYAEGIAVPVITYNSGNPAAINFDEGLVTTPVATMTATGTAITWSLSGADAAKFAIGSSSGIITAVAALDYETPTDANADGVYEITAVATSLAGADSIALSITVTDVTPKVALFTVALPTTVTTFDITGEGLGVAEQQRACIMWGGDATADGVIASGGETCYGWATGSGTTITSNVAQQIANASRINHGQTTNTDGHSESCTAIWRSITRNSNPVSAVESVVVVATKITNGWRFSVTDPPATAKIVTIMLLAGDIKAKTYVVVNAAEGDFVDQTIDFEPSLCIVAGTGDTFEGVGLGHGGEASFALSFWKNDKAGNVEGAGLGVAFQKDDALNSECFAYASNSTHADWDPSDPAAPKGEHSLSFPNATTLRVTTESLGEGTAELAVLCLDFGDLPVAVGIADFPASTGTQSLTLTPPITFRPQAMMFAVNRLTAVNTPAANTAAAGVWGLAAVARPGLGGVGEAERCFAQVSQYNVSPVNAQSLHDAQLFNVPDHAGANAIEATFSGFHSSGLAVNVSAAPGSSVLKLPFFAIGSVERVPGPPHLFLAVGGGFLAIQVSG